MMDELQSVMLAQIQVVEQKDEEQVLSELAGETINEYIYEVPASGKRKRVVKLSWAGTREMARARGNIALSDPLITEIDGATRIVVRATDMERNFSVFGGCHQPHQMKIREFNNSGQETGAHYEDDPFAFQKGLSKAQRNALQSCIPADYAAKMIDRFLVKAGKQPLLAKGNGKKAIAPAPKPASNIKPLEEWEGITEEQISTYAEMEVLVFNLCKLQPQDLYREFGVARRSEMTLSPWQAFLQIKELYAPRGEED